MKCRSCGSENTEMVFSLGDMPLANQLLDYPGEPFERYPLDLWVCGDCTLAQLGEIVAPEKMFGGYLYLSSYSPELVKQAEEIAVRMMNRGTEFLNKNSLVVEIGSNDGYLLQHYKLHGIPVLGVDPSPVAGMNAEILHGIPTLKAYFTNELAKMIVAGRGQAEVIHANNVLAHVPDVNDFVKGIKTLLKPDGVAVIEVQYAGSLTFDQIYHEHVFYFSNTALVKLLNRHGLVMASTEKLGTHGGSVRAFVRHSVVPQECPYEKIDWKAFALKAQEVKLSLDDMMEALSEKVIAGFGAAAKGTILLNYLEEPSGGVNYIVDDNPLKQGKWIPGTGIPVNGVDILEELPPHYMMILSWNYAEAVMKRFPQFAGRFIVPLPSPVIL